jgi:integrase
LWSRASRGCGYAGLDDVRLHDVRRTVGSWLASAGASGFLIQKALGHASIQSAAVYARLDLDPVRRALEETTGRMLGSKG